MRSANLFFFTQPQEMFEAWYQAQQNTPFEEKEEQFFAVFQQIPINYGTTTDTSYQDSLYWKEQHLYGSSRLGIAKPELEVTNYTPSNASKLTTNFRNYELTNHLGNVLSTIKDEKQQKDDNADGIVDYYEPIVMTANDYYPFGMVMPNRSFSLAGSGYRFGFNTQEKDDEVYGKGNLMTAKFWEYDARIGRRWNLDPVYNAFESRYLVNGGNPIWQNDPNGDYKNKVFAKIANFFKGGDGVEQNKDLHSKRFGEWFYKKDNNTKNGKEAVIKPYEHYGTKLDKNAKAPLSEGSSPCRNCINPSTIGNNLLNLSYPGGENPTTQGNDPSYSFTPLNKSEYPAIGHDRRYDNLKIQGKEGLFFDTRAIGADMRFVAEEFGIALNPFNDPVERIQAAGLGLGLGIAATPKTIWQLTKPYGAIQIVNWYLVSNQGNVNNKPAVHSH